MITTAGDSTKEIRAYLLANTKITRPITLIDDDWNWLSASCMQASHPTKTYLRIEEGKERGNERRGLKI